MTGSATADASFTPCARHDDAAAAFRCCECGSFLCIACAEQGSHLIVCRLCGERAVAVDELERPAPDRSTLTDRTPTRYGNPTLDSLETPSLSLVNHLIVPAATIVMVAALLFFLLDLRSIFFGGTAALKWVGFWFVTATVLIARYGRASAGAERQGCYTLALAGATTVAMTVAPWESPPDGLAGPLTNVVIILVVWRFASRLTASLSLEGLASEDGRPKARLYGTARLELEQWQREKHGPRANRKQQAKKSSRTFTDPGAAVARLAVGVLVLFALGEPFLLSAPPAVGERALAAMIVFLFATGVVLACGAGVGLLRRVQALGGETSPGAIPSRMLAAALVTVIALALALAMPGIEYRGDGSRRPPSADTGVAGGSEDGDAAEGFETEESSDTQKGARGEPQSSSDRDAGKRDAGKRDAGKRDAGKRDAGQEGDRTTRSLPASSQLLGWLSELGTWLRIPFFIAIGLLVLYGLWRLRPRLGGWRRLWLSGLRTYLARLMSAIRGVFRRRGTSSTTAASDPFANLGELHQGDPKDGVLAAYGRLLGVYDLIGHPRPERRTPYELLASLPARLRPLDGPAKALTEVYVKAAYSHSPVNAADRQGAITALEQLATIIDPSDRARP